MRSANNGPFKFQPLIIFFVLLQRVRKYHSVPVLRLIPSDRPLFFCDNCCSVNFYVPICLWCKWTSAAAIKNFEEKPSRARAMSTPRSCSDRPNLNAKMGGAMAPDKLDPRGSLDTDGSTEPPETPPSVSQNNNSSTFAALDEWVQIFANEAILVCRIDSSEPPFTFDLMFCCDLLPYCAPHSRSTIRITGSERVTRNNARQLLTLIKITALSYLSTDLLISPGAMMGTHASLNPTSPTTNRKGFVGPPTPDGAERKAKVTFPDSHVVRLEREMP